MTPLANVTNAEYEKAFLKAYPQWNSYTAKGTASLFKSSGFMDTILSDMTQLNSVFHALNRISLNIINVAKVQNPFELGDFGETYTSDYGAGVQRMAIYPMKPTSPKFTAIPSTGINQQAFRSPEVTDRFFDVNFNFQNYYSLQETTIRQMFINDYGISDFYSGFMAQMENSYKEQKYQNTLECLNAGINSVKHPMQSTQKLTLKSWTDNKPTADELKDFIKQIKVTVANMKAVTSSSAYNSAGFKTVQDTSRLKLLCRVGIKDLIDTELALGAFNPDRLTLPFDIIEVENFGGLVPYKEANFTTKLYPVYDPVTGEQQGYATEENAVTASVEDSEVFWKDPNEKVLALLVDKGYVFHIQHNAPRLISAPYNAAGLYVTMWYSVPYNVIKADSLYTLITISAPTA